MLFLPSLVMKYRYIEIVQAYAIFHGLQTLWSLKVQTRKRDKQLIPSKQLTGSKKRSQQSTSCLELIAIDCDRLDLRS